MVIESANVASMLVAADELDHETLAASPSERGTKAVTRAAPAGSSTRTVRKGKAVSAVPGFISVPSRS